MPLKASLVHGLKSSDPGAKARSIMYVKQKKKRKSKAEAKAKAMQGKAARGEAGAVGAQKAGKNVRRAVTGKQNSS